MESITKNAPIVERDISWMYFNHRILQEAQRKDVPLLERLSFLGIYSNNLDEFFSVRIATLSRLAELGDKGTSKEAAKHAQHVLNEINKLNSSYIKEFSHATDDVMRSLETEGINIINDTQVNTRQSEHIRRFFLDKLYSTTLPVWLSSIDQIVTEEDGAIYLAIKLCIIDSNDNSNDKRNKRIKKDYALLKMPVKQFGRFLRLPDEDGKVYLMWIDDAVRFCLRWIFAGTDFNHFEAYAFKFTKDAEMEMDNDMNVSKLQKVQKGVKSRKKGTPLRVIYDKDMPKELLKLLKDKLNLDKLDSLLPSGRYHNHKDFLSFPDCGRSDLKYKPQPPLHLPQFDGEESVFDIIRREDQFVHVPYHSFDAYLRFLHEASLNHDVKEIKTTLYRLAKDSKVISSLIMAAKNKKKVTVVIELLARFDETSNIKWSEKLREAGVNVVYGIEGLKIHSKITHVTTRYGNYAVIGTGNFHEGNARVYTDCMLFTASSHIVKDVEKVFKFIAAPFIPAKFNHLLVSPNSMKPQLLRLINTEIQNHRMGCPSYIRMKINNLTDTDMVNALYKASHEGVSVDILCRGNCALRTGLKGISDTIHVKGIIDRYLEHARILTFCNAGDEKCYIGSADWMPRNLDNRIEVMVPVYNERIKAEMNLIISSGLNDNMQARDVCGTGHDTLPELSAGEMHYRSQTSLYEHYKKQIEETLAQHNDKDEDSCNNNAANSNAPSIDSDATKKACNQ